MIMNKKEMLQVLESNDLAYIDSVFKQAYECKRKYVGRTVYFRGIIEFSNVCLKDCYYCGIRNSNRAIERFSMTADEIVAAAILAYNYGYGSIVLQSGERCDDEFIIFVEKVIGAIRDKTGNDLGITLSLGEQTAETYRRWFDAGAQRYLLRLETSNRKLYERLHPKGHCYKKRLACLDELRLIGYQVGTGVMIGLPYQSHGDLADDILFFREHDVDMIGMGPYVAHSDTPLAAKAKSQDNFLLSLKMIALTRLLLKDINIAATTALQALEANGREKALAVGANIIMPNITPLRYRRHYKLYEGKPCLDESPELCRACLEKRINSLGESIAYGQRGDSPRFLNRRRDNREDSHGS